MIIRKIYPGEITEHKLKNHKEMLGRKGKGCTKCREKVENISGISQKKNKTLGVRGKKESNVFT